MPLILCFYLVIKGIFFPLIPPGECHYTMEILERQGECYKFVDREFITKCWLIIALCYLVKKGVCPSIAPLPNPELAKTISNNFPFKKGWHM